MNNYLPNPDQEIHPWMPTLLHDGKKYFNYAKTEVAFVSRLGHTCAALNIGIHDREAVYEKMKRVEREIIAERDARR